MADCCSNCSSLIVLSCQWARAGLSLGKLLVGRAGRCTTAPSLAPHPSGSSLPISWELSGIPGLAQGFGLLPWSAQAPNGIFPKLLPRYQSEEQRRVEGSGGGSWPSPGRVADFPGSVFCLSQLGGRLNQHFPKGGSKSRLLRRTVLLGHCG